MAYNVNDHKELARYNLKQKQSQNRISITDRSSKQSSQSILYEAEKLAMFTSINNFMTKLIIDKDRFNNSKFYKSFAEENKILEEMKERMKAAHEVINQLSCLVHVEKCLWTMPTYDNTREYKRKYDELLVRTNWMKRSIDSVIERYNVMRVFLDLPKDNLYAEIKPQPPFKLEYMSKRKRQEIENQFRFKETQLILSDLRSPMELLSNRIVDHGITPVYRFLNKQTSGEQFVYRYSCTLYGMYVEGSGTSKHEAKKHTAAEMLRLIIKKQKNRTLSSHIRPFNEKELKSLSPSIKLKVNYVEALHKECVKHFFQPPIYTILSKTNNDKLGNNYSIQCDAMDLVAIGHSNKQSIAKEIAAQNIMKLWEKLNSKINASKEK